MNPSERQQKRRSVKMPYVTPQVQIYGDLRQVTQAQMSGNFDAINSMNGQPIGGTH